jgi:hypothetical protein
MANPIILRTKAETEGTARAFVSLATTVATSMGSISSAALLAHQSTGASLGGIAGTALKAAASLTAMQYVAIATFAAFSAAAAAGAAELEKFEAIAKKAADANVGTTFFQAFSAGAQQLRVEVKQLEGDLAALERSTRDRFDGDRATGVSNRARDLLQERFRGTNDFGLSSAPALFDAAKTAEERIQAVLVGLRDMEAAGQRLAAIDLARQLGLSNLAEQVERGKTSFAGFAAEVERTAATGVRDGSIISPDLIARADELKQRWEANTQELRQNLRPILDECARLALEIGNGAAWTAEQFTKLVGILGSAVRLMRDLASMVPGTIAGAQIATEDRARTAIETRLRDPGLSPLQRSGLEAQLRDVNASRARREASDVPEAPLSFNFEGVSGNGAPASGAPQTAPVPVIRPPAAGAGSTSSGGRTAAAETDEWAKAYEKLINNLEKTNAQLKAEFDTVGKSNVERTRAVELAKAEAEARRTGGTLTDEQRAKVLALAEAQAKLRDATKDAEAAQRAWADAIQYGGDRLVDMAFNGRSLQDVVRGLRAELLRAALTGQGIFGRLLGLAPSAGAPAGSVGGLLGLLGGGGGGGLFNLFGGGGGGSTGTNLLGDMLGFAGGGYTGAGDPMDVAGPVHRGEFVFDAAATSRLGVDTLEAIRQGRPQPRLSDIAAASSPSLSFTHAPTYDMRGASLEAVDRLEQQRARDAAEFESRVVDVVRDAQSRRML